MEARVKQEILDFPNRPLGPNRAAASRSPRPPPSVVIDISSSDSDSESENGRRNARVSSTNNGGGSSDYKRRKLNESGVKVPDNLLSPLSETPSALAVVRPSEPIDNGSLMANGKNSKQFWKAGDYEDGNVGNWEVSSGGMDHVRVHPRFLHSNATSHKWALGAFAELLDNSLDEVCNGATLVKIDMLKNKKDGSPMILIEDDGGGMDPDKMRKCMSLGFSAKSKMDSTIGQYGNGFKTSTMRLGADVIVFSRCSGQNGKRPTQSIGLLSYTFLRSTGKEDIVVPMLDYEREGRKSKRIARLSDVDWTRNVETIIQWSPFSSETDLLHEDIQLRGVNREEKNIQMAQQYPNSRHFLTYRHSLRSYASILYLRIPPGFRIILRGKDVEHHNIVNDMMMSEEVTYRPQANMDGLLCSNQMTAVVTIGFVKDAKFHIDVQGFNVYHKNRLIKPFWRLWNAAGSDGRGVIGVLEANFVEPAHDKQGFERTTVLARLETRLIQMQKNYWCSNCHKIGYAPRRNKKAGSEETETTSPRDQNLGGKASERSGKDVQYGEQHFSGKGNNVTRSQVKSRKVVESCEPSSPTKDANKSNMRYSSPVKKASTSTPIRKSFTTDSLHETRSFTRSGDARTRNGSNLAGESVPPAIRIQEKVGVNNVCVDANAQPHVDTDANDELKQEICELKERLERREADLRLMSLKCQKCSVLKTKLDQAEQKVEDLNKEQESLIEIFSEEKERRDKEEDNMRKKLKEASNTIQELLDQVKLLEKMKSTSKK
ncbi:Protein MICRORCHIDIA 4 [Linum perenne]